MKVCQVRCEDTRQVRCEDIRRCAEVFVVSLAAPPGMRIGKSLTRQR